MSQENVLETSLVDGALWLRLNRPHVRNAWTAELGQRVVDALAEAEADPEVRAVVLSGAGAGFCSGTDLGAQDELLPDGEPNLRQQHALRFMPTILAMRRLPKPVVSMVHGASIGYGCSLMLASDFVVMAESSYMRFSFARLGLLPDGGATALLHARVGGPRATEIAMLADPVPASQALAWGLVNRVAPDDELREQTQALVDRLTAGPTRAYGAIKRAFQAAEHPSFAGQLALEGDLLQELSATSDFPEGKTAFLSKREPAFRGH